MEVNIKVKLTSERKTATANSNTETVNVFNSTFKTVRKSVLQATSVRTAFTGFIISLINLYSICEKLMSENVINYFLSYELLQDHVEMFLDSLGG